MSSNMSNKLSTDSYKGVRDFYPEDMAIQRYIFQTWSKTAESFGFERYDASILEPSDLYRAKGAENEEMVNEQTYTFTDRGDREVTLRPEMTPTAARMIAGRRRELAFPVRWYSIPNLFRYERPQRGRLREHRQLNCDLFGGDAIAADVELIALAYQSLIDFGATPEMFEIRINDREEAREILRQHGVTSDDTQQQIIRLNDRKEKISEAEYQTALRELTSDEQATDITKSLSHVVVPAESRCGRIVAALKELGVTNVKVDYTIARGFDYYTSTVFEVFDQTEGNNRSMIGGGRYDNLTEMFGGEAISGVGFGMGDVTMRDFLETHKLIPEYIRSTAPHVMVIPVAAEQNLYAEQVAMKIRHAGHKVATDISTKKVGKKIASASDAGCKFVVVIGEDEMQSGNLTVKNLHSGEEKTGQLGELMNYFDVD